VRRRSKARSWLAPVHNLQNGRLDVLSGLAAAAEGGVLSQYIRNEFLYTSDEDIKILFPEKNPTFKIHEIVCVRG
jgi:hypothetical protein